jgi:hypothetical protein
MADHTDNALRAAVKALDDVVRPAVNPRDPLATEQLRITTELLSLMLQRLNHVYDRHRFELRHHLALGAEVQADVERCAARASEELAAALEAGRVAYDTPGTGSAATQTASARVAAAVSRAVRIAGGDGVDADARRRLERTVVASSKPFFDAQRAWFLPGGFEPEPQLVPTLEAALGLDPSHE